MSVTVKKHIGNVVLINLAIQIKSHCQFSWHVQSHYAPHETGNNAFSKCYWDYALDCHFSVSIQLCSSAFMLWRQERMKKKNEITFLKHKYDLLVHSPASFPIMGTMSKTNFTHWNKTDLTLVVIGKFVSIWCLMNEESKYVT